MIDLRRIAKLAREPAWVRSHDCRGLAQSGGFATPRVDPRAAIFSAKDRSTRFKFSASDSASALVHLCRSLACNDRVHAGARGARQRRSPHMIR